MSAPPAITILIEPLEETVCDEYFRYLNDHMSDNGQPDTGYFMPRSQNESRKPYDKEKFFRDGLVIPIGAPGWLRSWIARGADSSIIGHVDLRGHRQPNTGHRCLLGIGVHRRLRRQGLGAALLAHAMNWAVASTTLEWLDLEVLSGNQSALRLYERSGFTKVGELPEMFRIDGHSFSNLTMTRRLRPAPAGSQAGSAL